MEAAPDAPYLAVFETESGRALVTEFVARLFSRTDSPPRVQGVARDDAVRLASGAFSAFLQGNVTGPVLEGTKACTAAFLDAFEKLDGPGADELRKGSNPLKAFRRICLRTLDTDGVSVYEYIPHIELFCLARWVYTSGAVVPADDKELAWARFRIHLWHYKLLSRPSLGPGSQFTKTGRWTDVATLQEVVESSLQQAEIAIGSENRDGRVEFLLEKASALILLGDDAKARVALREATALSGFVYALSGALGKRTKFQEKSTSQLVVLAKSREDGENGNEGSDAVPAALSLNDDTLLEKISFNNDESATESASTLPPQLRDLSPENQPQLKPEDQIILLTEATIKDTFQPADALTSEEVMPFAVRVVEDKPTNWQIYTQALLVRSRIELNRSRTLERGVLQMQALVDQIIADTEALPETNAASEAAADSSTPTIKISRDDGSQDRVQSAQDKVAHFLPVAKSNESASPQVRLRYVNALSSPPRWHLEAELAHAWTSVGSLVSALEIFKRLRLWPEVALCLASRAATGDEDGRGGGGEEKAKAIIRWRLFLRTDSEAGEGQDEEGQDDIPDVDSLNPKDFYGPERSPPPPNAPRLFCILGDLENEPAHYERAWEISNKRYGRAQRSLGELYLRQKDWAAAREAYKLAVGVNRLNPELWSRLGDVELRLGNWPDAAEAFQRAIGTANGEQGGEDARTWSNLGTALLSWYKQVLRESKSLEKKKQQPKDEDEGDEDEDEDVEPRVVEHIQDNMPATRRAAELNKPSYTLLRDSLNAFKQGATIAHDNWRIWDNVVTLAASLIPEPELNDVVLGTRNVLRIRKSEDALDVEILGLVVREVVKEPAPSGDGVFEPRKGTLASKAVALFEEDVAPLITTDSAAWALVARLRAWRRDWAGAVDAAEKGWRAATGAGAGAGALSASASTVQGVQGGGGSWTVDRDGWEAVVQRTGELVAAYENWGARLEGLGGKWKGKARSAVRSVLSRARESWEGDAGWETLQGLMEDLRA